MPAEEEKEQEKVAIISSTNTIMNPRAVVIEAIDASKKEKSVTFKICGHLQKFADFFD